MPDVPAIRIPSDLLPSDGRFGSGPSKVRQAQVDALVEGGRTLLGTSHRHPPVRALVRRVREGMSALFALPDGYEVVLGNGGATAFWDAAAAALVRRRAQHLVFGDFSAKWAAVTRGAPFLDAPDVVEAAPGSLAHPRAVPGVDAYAWPQCETSTGVAAPVRRVPGADPGALVLVDATSAAGGLAVDVGETDAYFFSPQKAFAADGGLWVALLSPAAVSRVTEPDGAASGGPARWIPTSLSLARALEYSRQDQTLNTPALATLVLLADQVDWLLAQGGLGWAAARCADSAGRVYAWAERTPWASPFVADPASRSTVVATVDLDPAVDGAAVIAVLRANGVVDLDAYRTLRRNQLRIGTFPAVEPDDVTALLACVEHVTERLPPRPPA